MESKRCVFLKAMTKWLEQSWLAEVRQSRIVIQADESSYLADLHLPVVMVIEELAYGMLETDLMAQFDGLTLADLRACSLFMYLRTVGKI